MTFSFYYDFIIYSISVLWIIRDATLVLWTQTMKKREPKPKYISYLHITGIIFLAWSIISVFLPKVHLSYFPEESELLMYIIFNFILPDLIPIILGVFLGIALSLYFYNLYYQHNKKALLGSGLFLLGYILILFLVILDFSLFIFDYPLIDATYKVYLIGISLSKCIPLVGISFIFIYAIYSNNDFLITFCGLFFAYLMLSLVYSINTTIINFTSF